MEHISGVVRLSATDLVGHLNCGHLTGLDPAVVKGALERPRVWDPLLETYRVEATVRGQGPDVRLATRAAKSAPLLAELRT